MKTIRKRPWPPKHDRKVDIHHALMARDTTYPVGTKVYFLNKWNTITSGKVIFYQAAMDTTSLTTKGRPHYAVHDTNGQHNMPDFSEIAPRTKRGKAMLLQEIASRLEQRAIQHEKDAEQHRIDAIAARKEAISFRNLGMKESRSVLIAFDAITAKHFCPCCDNLSYDKKPVVNKCKCGQLAYICCMPRKNSKCPHCLAAEGTIERSDSKA